MVVPREIGGRQDERSFGTRGQVTEKNAIRHLRKYIVPTVNTVGVDWFDFVAP